MVNAQQYLNYYLTYPTNSPEAKRIDISNQELEGHLVISNFPNLEVIVCSNNKVLSGIELINLPKLNTLFAANCKIGKLTVNSCSELRGIDLRDNELVELDF